MKKVLLSLVLFSILPVIWAEVLLDNPWRAAQDQSFFAMNGSKVFHIPKELETTVKTRIEWMKELGVGWDRSDWWWHVMEPEKGRFDFSIPDKIVDYFEKQHIQIYPILSYGSAWWKGRNSPLTDEDYEDFGKYVYETVSRYKDHFTYWSVWNEPNIVPFWTPEPNPDHYARLLKIAYTQAKKADPDCKICAPVIAPLGAWDKNFTERLFQLGCMDYFDVFDYHYYRNNPPEDEVPVEIADIKALMLRYGEEKPIWISESGVSAPTKDKEKSYKDQAALIVRNQLLAFACGVKRFFYFDLQNWTDKADDTWDSKLGLVEAGGEKKPSFLAYKTMVKEVDFKKVIGRFRRPEEGWDAVLIFDPKHREYILAAWCPGLGNKKKVDFVCEPEDVKIVHPFGDVEMRVLDAPPAPDQFTRTVSVEIDQNPRYIHSVDPFSYLPEASVRLSPEKIYMNPGEKVGFRLEQIFLVDFFEPIPLAEVDIIKSDIPEGLVWDRKNGGLEASKNISPGTKILSTTVRVKRPSKFDTRTREFKTSATVEILPVQTLQIRPYMDKDELKVQATLVNQSPWDLKGAVSLVEIRDTAPKILMKKDVGIVKPQATWREAWMLDKKIVTEYKIPTVWHLKFQDKESKPFRIYTAPFRDNAPVIDGNLEEWKDVPFLVINTKEQMTREPEGWTPSDASSEVYFWFTPDAVNVAARVTDDDPMYNTHPPNFIWKGDALEVYLGFGGPAKRGVLDKKVDFQVGIAPDCEKKRPIVFLFHEDRILEDAKVAAQKIPYGYVIEASIPLKEFGSPVLSSGSLLGLDAAINDLDKADWAPLGNDPGCALMWNGTIRNWIDPSNWGMAVLRKE